MKKFNTVMFILFVAIFLYALFKLNEQNKIKNSLNIEQELLNIAKIPTDETEDQIIDFESIERINENMIGWITISGTSIDYPILQANDNEYYLNHSYSNTRNIIGSIFIDYKNTNDFTDTITSIYGHNVSNEYMLGSISKYKDNNYLLSHPMIEIYIRDVKYIYQINQFHEVNMEQVSSIINDSIDPSKNKIILITCSYSNGKSYDADLRYILVATKI